MEVLTYQASVPQVWINCMEDTFPTKTFIEKKTTATFPGAFPRSNPKATSQKSVKEFKAQPGWEGWALNGQGARNVGNENVNDVHLARFYQSPPWGIPCTTTRGTLADPTSGGSNWDIPVLVNKRRKSALPIHSTKNSQENGG